VSDTETLTAAPLIADNLIVVVADANEPSPRMPEAVRDNVRRVVGTGLTVFVVLCLALGAFLFAGTALMHSRYQRALRDEFRSESQLLTLPGSATTSIQNGNIVPVPSGAALALLRIPRLGVDEVVSEGTKSSNTLRGPGHLPATPLPGQLGNAVVIGRHSLGGAPFGGIGSLHPGDRFSFATAGGIVNYEVMTVGTHRASDMSIFGTQKAGGRRLNTATLVTTTGAFDTDKRLVVVGELQGTPAGFTPGRIAPQPDELGLAPDNSALLPLVFMLQLLLMASIGAVWLTKRWHRYAAWIVSAPVLLCTAWLVFEQFTRLLPAAL
jgi:sortase A